jgi:hypothetical protein
MGLLTPTPPLTPSAVRQRLTLFAALAVVGAAGYWLLSGGPAAQKKSYHDFADQRDFLGVPYGYNVLSNTPFLLVGALGVAFCWRRRDRFVEADEAWPYLVFFVGVGVTAFGSGYYHLDPDNGRLVWDRLPIAMAFMALFAAIVGERMGVRLGLVLLGPLMALGLASVFYWTAAGDLRPYYFVQGYPLVAIPLLLILFPPRYTRGYDLLIGVGWYVAAKFCELYDREVYRLLGEVVSGHTIKHLLGATGAFWVLRMLWLRRPVAAATAAA